MTEDQDKVEFAIRMKDVSLHEEIYEKPLEFIIDDLKYTYVYSGIDAFCTMLMRILVEGTPQQILHAMRDQYLLIDSGEFKTLFGLTMTHKDYIFSRIAGVANGAADILRVSGISRTVKVNGSTVQYITNDSLSVFIGNGKVHCHHKSGQENS